MSFHLLIVDDQEDILTSLSRRFERRGFRVSKATTLIQSTKVFQTDQVDVCICDMQLGTNETGLDLMTFHSLHLKYSVPIIILTGHELDGDLVSRARLAGAFDVFPKPTDFALLLESVRLAVGDKTS